MEVIAALQERLDAAAEPATRDWWERYLKGAIPFRGVKMGAIRRALHAWIAAEGVGTALYLAEQKTLALELLRQVHAEEKLAGILYLQEILLPAGAIDWESDLPALAALFQEGYIADWNTCDWLCVKVLGPLVQQQGELAARGIAAWRDAPNLWHRRAAGVAFVNLAPAGDANFVGFTDMLLEVCAATVRHPERFSQTGTGWVLRELSIAEPARVAAFIREHRPLLSHEAMIALWPSCRPRYARSWSRSSRTPTLRRDRASRRRADRAPAPPRGALVRPPGAKARLRGGRIVGRRVPRVRQLGARVRQGADHRESENRASGSDFAIWVQSGDAGSRRRSGDLSIGHPDTSRRTAVLFAAQLDLEADRRPLADALPPGHARAQTLIYDGRLCPEER